jgi:hypothetical protein
MKKMVFKKCEDCHSLAKGNLISIRKTNDYKIPNRVGDDNKKLFEHPLKSNSSVSTRIVSY